MFLHSVLLFLRFFLAFIIRDAAFVTNWLTLSALQLGTKAVPTAELEFTGATVSLLGPVNRGVPVIRWRLRGCLCCAVLPCATLCCAVLYRCVVCYPVLCYAVLCCAVPFCDVLWCALVSSLLCFGVLAGGVNQCLLCCMYLRVCLVSVFRSLSCATLKQKPKTGN